MSRKKLSIGDAIQARCARCRKTTVHTVIATGEGDPAEVRCNSCQLTSTARKPALRRSVDPHKAEREEWAALRPGMDVSRATDYSMTASYKAKSLVNHPVFGLGLVQRVTGPQKMAVLFADGQKIMRCQ